MLDLGTMEATVREMSYDSSRLPLGRLTPTQIAAGFEALRKVEQLVESTGGRHSAALADACSAFYTRVPHDFGYSLLPTLTRYPSLHFPSFPFFCFLHSSSYTFIRWLDFSLLLYSYSLILPSSFFHSKHIDEKLA